MSFRSRCVTLQDWIQQFVPAAEDAAAAKDLRKLMAGIDIIWRSVVATAVPPGASTQPIDYTWLFLAEDTYIFPAQEQKYVCFLQQRSGCHLVSFLRAERSARQSIFS